MEEKLKDFASKAGKGGMPGAPKGLGLGVKLLAAGAAAVYGVQQSMYTGKSIMKKYLVFYITSGSPDSQTNLCIFFIFKLMVVIVQLYSTVLEEFKTILWLKVCTSGYLGFNTQSYMIFELNQEPCLVLLVQKIFKW